MEDTIYTIEGNVKKIADKHVDTDISESKLSCSQKIEAVLVGLAAFLTNAIIIGFAGSLGIYYVEFKQYFVENHGLITFSVFLPTGVFGSVGLLAGLFMNKFGVRITGVSGSILLTIGIGTCFFAHSVVFLLPFLGVFAGIGCSLVYLTVSMSMCNYFQHKGRLLMPLITMGEGVGTIIFPIITTYFINVYSWRGSMLMMAGVMLQAAVCVFMYSIKNRKQHKANTSDRKQEDAKSLQPSNGVDSNFGTHSNSNLQTQTNIIPASFQTDSMPEKQPENRLGSVSDPTVPIIQNYKTENGDRKEGNLQVSVNGFLANESQELKVPDLLSNFEAEKNTKVIVEDKKIPPIDIFLSILKDEQYVLFLISVCIISGSIHTTLTLLPDFCVSKGLTLMHGAHVYAIGASGDIMARLFGSWLLYKHNTSSLMIYTLSGIVLSMLIAIYPLLSKFSLLSTLSFFVMTFCGLIFSVYNVVILDFFDLKMYAIAMGMSETVAGIGIVIIGYGIGLVTEYNEGNYSISFFLLGGLTMISMLPMIILYVKKCRPSTSYNLS